MTEREEARRYWGERTADDDAPSRAELTADREQIARERLSTRPREPMTWTTWAEAVALYAPKDPS